MDFLKTSLFVVAAFAIYAVVHWSMHTPPPPAQPCAQCRECLWPANQHFRVPLNSLYDVMCGPAKTKSGIRCEMIHVPYTMPSQESERPR